LCKGARLRLVSLLMTSLLLLLLLAIAAASLTGNKKDGYRQRNVRQFLQSAKAHYLATSRESLRYVVAGAGIWVRQESLRHILASLGTPLR